MEDEAVRFRGLRCDTNGSGSTSFNTGYIVVLCLYPYYIGIYRGGEIIPEWVYFFTSSTWSIASSRLFQTARGPGNRLIEELWV